MLGKGEMETHRDTRLKGGRSIRVTSHPVGKMHAKPDL